MRALSREGDLLQLGELPTITHFPQLPGLVENNWAVAVQCVVKLLNTTSASVSGEYLRVLEGLDMSFHSIETFSGLSADADLPPDFTRRYLAKCMLACENIKDKFSQVSPWSFAALRSTSDQTNCMFVLLNHRVDLCVWCAL